MIATPPPDILALIDQVVEQRVAAPEDLARLLDGHATKHADNSNPYYTTWTVTGSRKVERAELRLPREVGSPRMIVIDFRKEAGACVCSQQVISRYGEPPELNAPTPRQPAGSPTYYVYRRQWGDLSMGIDDRDCLTSVVLDAVR